MIDFKKYENGIATIDFHGLLYEFDSVLGAKIAIDTDSPAAHGRLKMPLVMPRGLKFRVENSRGEVVCFTSDPATVARMSVWGYRSRPASLKIVGGAK